MFRRRRTALNTDPDELTTDQESPDQADASADDTAAATERASGAREGGPWDVATVGDPAAGGRIDLGGLWLPGRPGMELRVEIDQETQRVSGIAVIIGQGALQVQPFAAPRNAPQWNSIREEIAAGIIAQGGQAIDAEGRFGTELHAHVPVAGPDGAVGLQRVRFVGVDGPRWFLRGVLSGAAADDAEAAAPLEGVFGDVVVVRGGEAMAPREPIPLRLPEQNAAAPADGDAEEDAEEDDSLDPFTRGPEITEVR